MTRRRAVRHRLLLLRGRAARRPDASRGWTRRRATSRSWPSSAATTSTRPTARSATASTARAGSGPSSTTRRSCSPTSTRSTCATVLTAGGRYVCGNPNSIMPVWSNTGNPPGPLNYKDIEYVIAFIRAQQGQEFRVMDPGLFEPVVDPVTGEEKTFEGWVDPNWQPEPGATPVPACWSDAFAAPASPAPSGGPGRVRRARRVAGPGRRRSSRSGRAQRRLRPDELRPRRTRPSRSSSTTRTPGSRTTSRSRTPTARPCSRARSSTASP